MKKTAMLVLIIILVVTGCATTTNKTTSTPPQQPSPPTANSAQASAHSGAQTAAQTGTPQTPQSQAQTSVMSSTAQWVGLKDDKVGPMGLAPDGKPDGHLHLTLAFPEAAKIKYIDARYKGFGQNIRWEWVFNSSLPATGAPVGVFLNAAMVARGTDVGLEVPAITELDLYLPELKNENGLGTFKFEKGETINIQVFAVTASGKNISADANVSVNM